MPDALRLQISADSSDAQGKLQLVVDNTKQLQDALSGAGASGLEAGNEISEGMEKANYSMMEARHSAMLLGEETGVKIPRALAGIAARSETLGPILAAAFSGIALVAFAELIVKATEKFEKWIEDTFIFTEAMRTISDLNQRTNSDIVEQNNKLKELKETYEAIGLTGSAAQAKKFEFFNADSLQPMEDKVHEIENAVGYVRKGFADTGEAVTITNAKLAELNALLPKGEQMKMLPSSATEEQALTVLMEIQGDYQKRLDTLRQEGANRQKEYEVTAAKEQEKLEKKQYELALKISGDIAKAHAEMNKQIEEQDKETSKIQSERLETELKAEEKTAEAAVTAAERQDKAYIAMEEGEIKSLESAESAKEKLIQKEFAAKRMSGEQYLASLRELYNSEVNAVMNAINQEEDLYVMAAELEASKRGETMTDEQARETAGFQDLENKKLAIQQQFIQKYQAAEEKMQQQIDQAVNSSLSKMNSEFASTFANIEMGHETLAKGVMKEEDAIAMNFLKNMATTMMAEIEGALLHRTLAQQKQIADAKGAAGGAYNAVAGIPIIGPVLAPIAAATAFAGVMAFDEGGMVPEDQMAMVHSDEAVLTPKQTEQFQQMAENGGGDTHNYGDTHIHAMDPASFKDFLRRNPSALGAGMRHAINNGHFSLQNAARGK